MSKVSNRVIATTELAEKSIRIDLYSGIAMSLSTVETRSAQVMDVSVATNDGTGERRKWQPIMQRIWSLNDNPAPSRGDLLRFLAEMIDLGDADLLAGAALGGEDG